MEQFFCFHSYLAQRGLQITLSKIRRTLHEVQVLINKQERAQFAAKQMGAGYLMPPKALHRRHVGEQIRLYRKRAGFPFQTLIEN